MELTINSVKLCYIVCFVSSQTHVCIYIMNAELTSVCIALAAEIHCHLTTDPIVRCNVAAKLVGLPLLKIEKIIGSQPTPCIMDYLSCVLQCC